MSAVSKDPSAGIRVITAPDRLDIGAADEFRDELQRAIDEGRYKIVVNLASTRYIDSSGLGSIVSRIAAARAYDGDIRIAAARKNIIKLFELTQLEKVLQCFENEEEAIASFTE